MEKLPSFFCHLFVYANCPLITPRTFVLLLSLPYLVIILQPLAMSFLCVDVQLCRCLVASLINRIDEVLSSFLISLLMNLFIL